MSTATPIPATALQPTALARHLAASGSGGEIAPYLGALTPLRLDAAEVETGALLTGAAVHDLGWLRRYAVRGEDRFRWLSGMVTNAVESLEDRRGAYNLVLNAQGRIQGDAWVWRDGDAVELEVAADQADALLAHLDRFIIMDDVEVVPLAGESALGLTGPGAAAILARLGFAGPSDALPCDLSSAPGAIVGVPARLFRGYGPVVPHYALWARADDIPALWQAALAAGATPAGSAALESLRIAEGIPAYGVDIQSRDLPQETGQLRAISFTKGCYLGQEIVERIRSRGQVHRHLRALELTPEPGAAADESGDLPAPGTELRVLNGPPDARPAATLTSVASLPLYGRRRVFAIAMVRAEAEIGGQPLQYSGGKARILHSPPKLT